MTMLSTDDAMNQAVAAWIRDCEEQDVPFEQMQRIVHLWDDDNASLPPELRALFMLGNHLEQAAIEETSGGRADWQVSTLRLMKLLATAAVLVKEQGAAGR